MFKQKRAELTTQQIVLLIILITSFAVILILFFRLDLGGEETQKEICHNSVVLKGKSISGVSLDCRTNYVCISSLGGSCEAINPTQTIEIDLSKDAAKNETMKAIAEEMSDCWWQFGEGKVDYLSLGDKGIWDKNTCAVCSIVKFDKKIQEEAEKITYEEFYDYLEKTEKTSSQKYLKYLYGVSSLDNFYSDRVFEAIKNDVDGKKEIDFEAKYMIRTGVSSKAFFGNFGFSKDHVIYPYFFDANQIPDPQCDEFITKA